MSAPRVSVYSSAWNVNRYSFDFKGALDNWVTFAQEISLAIPLRDEDNTFGTIEAYAKERGYPVVFTRTGFPLDGSDSFAYGRTENAALQACTGDILCQSNLDERMAVSQQRIEEMHAYLQSHPTVGAFFVPTIDLYGSYQRAAKVGQKWYWHRPGLFRGAVRSGIKADGRPDYNKTSSDELVSITGDLVPTVPLCQDLSIEGLRAYVAAGWPISYHLGYFDLKSRADRAKWWGQFWVTATGGDTNTHVTDVAELEKRHTFEHGLPLWPTLS